MKIGIGAVSPPGTMALYPGVNLLYPGQEKGRKSGSGRTEWNMHFYKKLLYLLGILCTCNVLAQPLKPSVIHYLDQVPVMIEASLYEEALRDSAVAGQPLPHFNIYSRHIRIGLASRRKPLVFTDILYAGEMDPCIPVSNYRFTEYRYYINRDSSDVWHPLMQPIDGPRPAAYPFSGRLCDTTLSPGESLYLEFRDRRTHKLLVQYIFRRRYQPRPEISGITMIRQFDSLESRIRSAAHRARQTPWPGMPAAAGDTLHVLPGFHLNAYFSKAGLNTDSCIFYRILDEHGKIQSPWKLTGHMLTATGLKANHHYILEARYADVDTPSRYVIDMAPFWYQTWIATGLFIIAGCLLLLVFPFLYYRHLAKKRALRITELEDQLKMVRNKFNPHFVDNIMGCVQGMISRYEIAGAIRYLSLFSRILRNTLANSDKLSIPLDEELSALTDYMMLQQLIYDYTFTVDISPEIEPGTLEIPPYLLQPTIENAIKHGVGSRHSHGNIILSLNALDGDLEISVTDNGNPPRPGNFYSDGQGIKLTKETIGRIQQLNRQIKILYSIQPANNGTTVIFLFKNWLA